jgi:tryptophan-rich sensory protein
MNVTLFWKIFFCIFPILSGFLTQLISALDSNAGITVKFRPPGWVFSVVWTILYILLGFSWAIAAITSERQILAIILYLLLVLSLCVWIFVYGRSQKTVASWILIIALAFGFASASMGNEASKAMISPLLAWLIFAMIMNTTEIENM